MSRSLVAGVAVSDITPQGPVAMSGFAARTELSVDVHDPLSARAVALEDGPHASIVLAADLVMLTIAQCDELRRAISENTGLGLASVVVSVTHTHAGPHSAVGGLGEGADPEYVTWLESELVATAVRAWEARRPARIGHGYGRERTVAHNRRHEGGIVDPTVTAVRVDDAQGEPMAVLFSYACHPVVLGPTNLMLSADWPGEARRRVEERVDGAVAVFLQGCCGDVNTGHSAHDSMDPSRSALRTFEESARVGRLLGDVVADLAVEIRTGPAAIAAVQGEVVMPFAERPSPAELDRYEAEVDAELVGPVPSDREVILRGRQTWLRSLRESSSVSSLVAAVSAHQWGDLTVVTVPGEAFVQISLDIRAGAPGRDMLVLGYCNGVPGYVPHPPAEYEHGGYEIEEAHYFYGQPQCFDPGCGPSLVAAARRALDLLWPDAR